MNTFRVHLLATDRSETIEGVAHFVGEDGTGSFGMMAHHARFMTVLVFGLARLRMVDNSRRFVGLPGGLLYFIGNELRISTSRYLLGNDAGAIADALAQQMLAEQKALAQTLSKLHQLEAQMLQRLARLELE
jgi:F-type H+-transporting ATPase subunit epsilon